MNKKIINLDLTGFKCPLPVIKTAKKLKEIKSDEILQVITDDPSAEGDLLELCKLNKYQIFDKKKHNKVLCVMIKKI
tara:strand:+ start:210 stop:440 length:231 start_codon:yes stop_codon:yes gene_type:complete